MDNYNKYSKYTKQDWKLNYKVSKRTNYKGNWHCNQTQQENAQRNLWLDVWRPSSTPESCINLSGKVVNYTKAMEQAFPYKIEPQEGEYSLAANYRVRKGMLIPFGT